MHESQPLGLLDEGSLLRVRQLSPSETQLFTDLGVVHVRLVLADLPPLHLAPDHEGIHRPLDVVAALLTVGRVGVRRGTLLGDLNLNSSPA